MGADTGNGAQGRDVYIHASSFEVGKHRARYAVDRMSLSARAEHYREQLFVGERPGAHGL